MRTEIYPEFIKALVEFLKFGRINRQYGLTVEGGTLPVNKYVELGIHPVVPGAGKNAPLLENNFTLVAPLFAEAYAVDIDEKCYEGIKHIGSLKWYNMTTDDFIENEMPKIGMVDFVFIDACHTHKQSLKDFLGITPYVRDHGIILLHDSYPPDKGHTTSGCGDVWKTAEKIRRDPEINKDFEIVTLPSEYGISIIRKASRQTHWSHAWDWAE